MLTSGVSSGKSILRLVNLGASGILCATIGGGGGKGLLESYKNILELYYFTVIKIIPFPSLKIYGDGELEDNHSQIRSTWNQNKLSATWAIQS